MQFTWKLKTGAKKKPRSITGIQLQDLVVGPAYAPIELSLNQPGSIALCGNDELTKALFCDLCFGFIAPESGSISPVLDSNQLVILGRSATTYGKTILEHLTYRVNNASRRQIIELAIERLNFKKQELLVSIDALQLQEKDFLAIAELNAEIRSARYAIIDCQSETYQRAWSQGFKHSISFLQKLDFSFWLLKDKNEMQKYLSNETKIPNIQKLDFIIPTFTKLIN